MSPQAFSPLSEPFPGTDTAIMWSLIGPSPYLRFIPLMSCRGVVFNDRVMSMIVHGTASPFSLFHRKRGVAKDGWALAHVTGFTCPLNQTFSRTENYHGFSLEDIDCLLKSLRNISRV